MSRLDPLFGIARRAGLHRLSLRARSGQLNILCYHGFSFVDEHLFRPKLFMQPSTLRRRMQFLRDHGFTVTPLGEALEKLRDGRLADREIAITLDDGFRSVGALAMPIFEEFGFPVTLYVTTYYVDRPNPIFRLVLQYAFWKTTRGSFEASGLGVPGIEGDQPTKGPDAGDRVLWQIIEHGESERDEAGRVELARAVCERLGIDYAELERTRRLSLHTSAELTELAGRGLDLQLHTHRHRLPTDPDEVAREIVENRASLAPLTHGRAIDHLCYPSGVWSKDMWPVLEANGVVSATTCDPGWNARDQHWYGLKRFLDFDDISQETFNAEMLGLKESLRALKRRLGR